MKTLLALTALATVLSAAPDTDQPVVLIPWQPATKEAPLFFSATAEVKAEIRAKAITSTQQLAFHVHQGVPRLLSLALGGVGDITAVTGDKLVDWSVRVTPDGVRFLDLRPLLPTEKDAKPPHDFKFTVTTRQQAGDTTALLLPCQGPATSLALELTLAPDPAVECRVVKATGLLPVAGRQGLGFVGAGTAALDLTVRPAGTAAEGLELSRTELVGTLAADGNSVTFVLTTSARAAAADARLQLCSGAALASGVSGEGWHLALRQTPGGTSYDLVAERPGDLTVSAEWVVPVTRKGDWRTIGFRFGGGVVVPLRLAGLPKGIEFDRTLSVVPEAAKDPATWLGFLPAGGEAALAWRTTGAVADGALFFSSAETTDLRVGSGLLRQMTVSDLRVLQGRLPAVSYDLTGPGEILSVTGDGVLGWSVTGAANARKLAVRLSQPITTTARLVIESQAALGAFPVKTAALRFAPQGALRHSGWLRIANEGAVRVEVADATGLIQLAPAQFPAGVDPSLRQVFVYRFPAAQHGFTIQADQIMPEVAVTETTTYEVAEVDRRIISDLQLDIREAPLREWEFEIPTDYAVAGLTGAAVADYVPAGSTQKGTRRVRVVFKEPVAGLQLVNLRLEQNIAAKPGQWDLPQLGFPGCKSRRGTVGVMAAAGYRLVVGKTTGVAEIPLTALGGNARGIQQAFRLREPAWSVQLTLEALGQSIQADVFHLYSLKAGAAYGSVIINYFVVGAPASEWRVAVPKEVGNIEVTGQNVGRDWRREGDTVIVPLTRPLLGAGTVLLTFEQPMDSRSGALAPGEVRPLGVQNERGHIQVISPMQVKYSVEGTTGTPLEIDASELPAEFRVLSASPTLKAWQYTARPFAITTKVEWFTPGETAAQVVDFLKLSSHISRDGEWSTDVRAFVKSRAANTLRVTLPDGVPLWELRVNGQPVNARQDGGHTLVPLPPGADAKRAVEVAMRYGARAPSASSITLSAPKLDAPVVISEWEVTGDEGRQLVPAGGNADLVKRALPETGFAWLARHPGPAILTALLAAFAAALGFTKGGRVRQSAAILCGSAAAVLALGIAFRCGSHASGGAATLKYAAPVVMDHAVTLTLGNVATWRAFTHWGVWLLAAGGLALVLRGALLGSRWYALGGLALLGMALLAIHGGLPLFFGFFGLVSALWCLPRVIRLIRGFRTRTVEPAAAALLLGCALLLPHPARAADEPDTAPPAAESMIHDWSIANGRLRGTVEVAVRGRGGDRFLLLQTPAVLSGFDGAGLKVVKAPSGNGTGYYLVLEKDGRATGKAGFEMPLPDPAKGWLLPAGPAAMRRITVRWDQRGWEFTSPSAARTVALTDLPESASGAMLTLNTDSAVTLTATPRQRDVAAEETRFFAEASSLFLPGPGVVGGRHRVSIRPAQGRVSQLTLTVPSGFTVSDVTEGPVDSWRFDPTTHTLHLTITPAQSQPFALSVETQRGADALPVTLPLAPLRVTGSAGEVGFLAIACGDDAQVESVDADGLARVSTDDFDRALIPQNREKQPLATLHHAYRYGSGKATASARIAALEPELRAESRQLVSLGDDRLLLETDLTIAITRAGVFRLRVELPELLEIESATGEGLSHWTEMKENGKRLLVLHLREKSTGAKRFNIVLAGPSPGARASWSVPRVRALDVSRESGVLTVVPEQGLQVRAVQRQSVSQLDPQELLDTAKGSNPQLAKPGALAYRLLQADWSLTLAVARLDPWVTARVFHETTLREGQMLTRLLLDYQIENAAIKTLRVGIPGLDAAAAATVRASGSAVADLVPVPGAAGQWEIRFQRGIIGRTRVELQYQRRSVDHGGETIAPVTLTGTRPGAYFAAIRSGGRLELEAGAMPRGWERSDWSVAQSALGAMSGATPPLLVFRLSEPDGPLPVKLKQLDLTELQRLRVASGTLTTLLAPDGMTLTAADLKLEVAAKGPLVLTLPADATPFNVRVNDEPANLVRVGGGWQFHVFPAPQADQPASVRFIYAAAAKATKLEGPGLAVPTARDTIRGIPMENLTWRVLIPEGWQMSRHSGDFLLRKQAALGSFGLDEYFSQTKSKLKADSQRASSLLNQANTWLREGKQELASQALGNALRSNQLDEATNEDARVLEFKTKTEQTMLGLNTRRQRVQLDNRRNNGAEFNERLDRAAAANPLLDGKLEFDPRKLDQLLDNNTSEEVSAMRAIAAKLVSQQLAAEAAPQALEVNLPERGTALTFVRSVQIADTARPMTLNLTLRRSGRSAWFIPLLLCLALGTLALGKRKTEATP